VTASKSRASSGEGSSGSRLSTRRSKQTLPFPAPLPEAITSSADAVRRSRRSAVGPPGESDVALAKPLGLPVVREPVVGPVRPPHVVAGCIDELELQGIGQSIAPHVQQELEARGIVDRQGSVGRSRSP
jgi:hypothetical protein